jgi:transcriptional regulator with XRE-family HTH domain
MSDFPERLKKYREDKGMTQAELAAKVGVSAVTITRYEKGVREPNMDTLSKIAKILECTLDDMLGVRTIVDGDVSDELNDYLDELHKRPEMKMLFKVAKKATKEDVEKAVKIIEMFKGKPSDDDDI